MKTLKDTIIENLICHQQVNEKLIINKDSKLAEIKTEGDFVKKYNLECVKWDSSSHNYKLSKDFYNKIINKFNKYNDFKDKLQDYIKNTLKLPNGFEFQSMEHYNNNNRKLTLSIEDLNIADAVCYISFLKKNNILEYTPYSIQDYSELKGVIFRILDFIIEI